MKPRNITILTLALVAIFALVGLLIGPPIQSASAQAHVKWTKDSGNLTYNCAGAACELGPFDTPTSEGFSCYVYNGSNASRNLSVTLYRDDGSTVAFVSSTLACATTTNCAITVHPQATTAVANTAVVPAVPTRRAKLTVAAAGTSGNATAFCLGR